MHGAEGAPVIPSSVRAANIALLDALRAKDRRISKRSLVGYCRHMWPDEPPPLHAEYLLAKLQDVERGELKRLMIFMPPGHTKSTYASVRFPSWYMGRNPRNNLIHVSYAADLTHKFGRRIRNIVSSPEFGEIFHTNLADDSQARGDWSMAEGGEYFAAGMDGAITGRRADGLIIDDPLKGRKEADSKTIRDNGWETYRTECRTRLKKGGWIIIICTRWHEDDIPGRILPESWNGHTGWVKARPEAGGEDWYVVSMPAMIETQDEADNDPLGRKIGEALWPDWKPAKELEVERTAQGTRNWGALYQQKPTTEAGAILKAKFWREWPLDDPPVCDYILQSYDTAFEEGEEDDCSARTTWGIFDWNAQDAKRLPEALLKRPPPTRYHAILLEHWMDKVQYAELKKLAKASFTLFKPDRVLIEKKASGHVLIQDMRRGGLPAKPWLPDRSKLARAHAAAVVFEQGCVWHMRRAWAAKVIRNCAQFPNGEYDDDVDTVTQAMMWFRKVFLLELPEDEKEPDTVLPEKRRKFYG